MKMRRYASSLGLAGVLVLNVHCARPEPPDTRAADVKAVQNIEVAWNKDAAAKDADKYANYYADDAMVLMPNSPIVTGKENIRAALRPMMSDPNFSITFQATRVEASKGGDFAYAVGTYSVTSSDPRTQKPVADKGKYLTVYRKQADGSWKVVGDTFNSDLPVAGTGR